MSNIVLEDTMIKSIYDKISDKNLKVVLPEGEDDRVIEAIGMSPGITKILLGNKTVIEEKISVMYGDKKFTDVEIIDQSEFQDQELIDLFVEKRKGKASLQDAQQIVDQANYYATLLVESGRADALVGGCQYSTADILKPAFQIIKAAPGNSVVSSCFLLKKDEEQLIFADCAVNINPNKDQLKEITLQTITTARSLGIEPRVAMLSYSTKGSGSGDFVDLTRTACEELLAEHPELVGVVDGELQFDAAYVSKVGTLKAPESKVAGQANVFIFPHIAAGNIAYKMVQYLGGYEAVGPLLQGLNKPVNDLSRGTDGLTIAKVMYYALRSK